MHLMFIDDEHVIATAHVTQAAGGGWFAREKAYSYSVCEQQNHTHETPGWGGRGGGVDTSQSCGTQYGMRIRCECKRVALVVLVGSLSHALSTLKKVHMQKTCPNAGGRHMSTRGPDP